MKINNLEIKNDFSNLIANPRAVDTANNFFEFLRYIHNDSHKSARVNSFFNMLTASEIYNIIDKSL